MENVVTYSSFSLLQRCHTKISRNTFHSHHKINSVQKIDLPRLLFFQLLANKQIREKKYLLFNELSVTRAQIGDFSLFKNILKYFSLVKIRQLNLKEKSLKLSMNHGAY